MFKYIEILVKINKVYLKLFYFLNIILLYAYGIYGWNEVRVCVCVCILCFWTFALYGDRVLHECALLLLMVARVYFRVKWGI
jgi:hypothetical protein